MKTSSGKKGGTLVGKPHYDKSGKPVGGIKAVVTDTNQPLELEGGEVIINKVASRKYWRELSKINQSAGGGVAIQPPDDVNIGDPDEYKRGGKVGVFNPNETPSVLVMALAKAARKKFPKTWESAGGSYADEAYKNLFRVASRGYWLDDEEWMYFKWKQYQKRNTAPSDLREAITCLKWCCCGANGLKQLREIVNATSAETTQNKKIPLSGKKPEKKAAGGAVGYDARVQANLEHMGTPRSEWKAVGINGFSEQVDDKGKMVMLPNFDFPKGYLQAQSLYMNGSSDNQCCELCGKQPIKIIYWLQNDEKRLFLRVGSECVGRFEDGKSGKQNEREAKIKEAACLDTDVVTMRSQVVSNFSQVKSLGYGRKERVWSTLFIGAGNYFVGSQEVHQLYTSGQLNSILDPKRRNKEEMGGYWLAKNLKPYYYESALEPNSGISKESADQQLLSWYSRNHKKYSEMLEAWNKLAEIMEYNKMPEEPPKAARGGVLNRAAASERREHGDTLISLKNGEISIDDAALKIAKDHLKENPHYYDELLRHGMRSKMKDGGKLSTVGGGLQLKTPTGVPSKLTYMQQILVRTPAFKTWFGDWEASAKAFIADGMNNWEMHYKGVSKIINVDTLEPYAVFHETSAEKEFFIFTTNFIKENGNIGKPYSYFAYNKEYAQAFSIITRNSDAPNQYIYEGFVKSIHPFVAFADEFSEVLHKPTDWLKVIVSRALFLYWGYNGSDSLDEKHEKEWFVKAFVPLQGMLKEIENMYGAEPVQFWKIMARDLGGGIFKQCLVDFGFDGILYTENLSKVYDREDPMQYTPAVAIFNSEQFKLGDGRNTSFDGDKKDIRSEDGGNVDAEDGEGMEYLQVLPPELNNKRKHIQTLIKNMHA